MTHIWIAMLIALVVAQTAMSVLLQRGAALTTASDLIQGTLLLAATIAFVASSVRTRRAPLNSRLFWCLMSAGIILWSVYQGMWNYFEVVKHQDVPNPFAGDVILFLHLVPMIAALGMLPHLREDERDERIRLLDFALLLTWWIFTYVYAVIPWQTVQVDEAAYSANFNLAYLTEKLALLIALAVVSYTAKGGWRHLYRHWLGATIIYASSSYVANWAIARRTYYSGSLYDIPLTLSIAWIAAIPLISKRVDLTRFKPSRPMLGVWITRLSVLALFSLLGAALRAELDPALPPAVKIFRITVALLTVVIMGVVVFLRQRLLRDELSRFLDRSRRSLDDLKALQEQLIQSEKLASLGQLVGGAAHEINNPLTAMLGYSDLLSASNLPPEEKLQAAKIGEEVRRTTSLVSSLLTFARQAPARLGSVDLNSVLQTAVRLLKPRTDALNISIQLDLAPSLPPVLADSNQILHVCMHLAGQIKPQLAGQGPSNLLIRTAHDEKLVTVDFLSGSDLPVDSAAQTITAWASNSGTASKPAALSLNACFRILEEHGGRLLQASTPFASAFRLELQIANSLSSPSLSGILVPSRIAARGSA